MSAFGGKADIALTCPLDCHSPGKQGTQRRAPTRSSSMKYKSTITRREATLALAAAATGIGGAPVRAQAKYPNRPVRVILPFGAGGVADVTAPLVADPPR